MIGFGRCDNLVEAEGEAALALAFEPPTRLLFRHGDVDGLEAIVWLDGDGRLLIQRRLFVEGGADLPIADDAWPEVELQLLRDHDVFVSQGIEDGAGDDALAGEVGVNVIFFHDLDAGLPGFLHQGIDLGDFRTVFPRDVVKDGVVTGEMFVGVGVALAQDGGREDQEGNVFLLKAVGDG